MRFSHLFMKSVLLVVCLVGDYRSNSRTASSEGRVQAGDGVAHALKMWSRSAEREKIRALVDVPGERIPRLEGEEGDA